MKTTYKTIGVITIFSVAMAALESAVVVYLRALYYPDQFDVKFKIIDHHILLVEIVRELATLIMLGAIGYMAGKNARERFAYFLLSFAIWDIFYYGWLKVFINWPASIFDWDILFLIPITWIGPVAAPIICSITMIILGLFLLQFKSRMTKTIWTCLIAGTFLILFTFMRDYAGLIIENGFAKDFPNLLQNPNFITLASTLSPDPYAWNIFWAGELLYIIGIVNVRINRGASI